MFSKVIDCCRPSYGYSFKNFSPSALTGEAAAWFTTAKWIGNDHSWEEQFCPVVRIALRISAYFARLIIVLPTLAVCASIDLYINLHFFLFMAPVAIRNGATEKDYQWGAMHLPRTVLILLAATVAALFDSVLEPLNRNPEGKQRWLESLVRDDHSIDEIKTIIKFCPKINLQPALEIAVSVDNNEAISLLCAAGAKMTEECVLQAIQESSIETVKIVSKLCDEGLKNKTFSYTRIIALRGLIADKIVMDDPARYTLAEFAMIERPEILSILIENDFEIDVDELQTFYRILTRSQEGEPVNVKELNAAAAHLNRVLKCSQEEFENNKLLRFFSATPTMTALDHIREGLEQLKKENSILICATKPAIEEHLPADIANLIASKLVLNLKKVTT